MRVLHVFTRLNAGGPARQALDLLPLLGKKGVESLLAFGACPEGEPSWDEEAARRGIPLARIPGLGKGEGGALRALAALVGLIDRFRPDIVHTNMARAGALGRAAALARGVPARVHTFHGHVFRGYFPPPVSLGIRWAEKILALTSTRLAAVSPAVKADLVRLGVGPEKKITLLEPCLDLAPFRAAGERPGKKKKPGGGPVVGWAGRMVPVKDPFLFGRVAGELAREFPGGRFLAAGTGPLLQEARRTGGPVEWLGHVEDMPGFYAGLDLLLLTSKNEGLPLVLVEAMAAGVPVLAPPVGGVGDLLGDGRGGVLAGDRNKDSIVKAAGKLLREGPALERMGAEARKKAAFFDLSRGVERHLAFYEGLARTRH